MTLSWWQRLVEQLRLPAQGRSRARRPQRYRPRFEPLENRLAPATRTWDGGALATDRWTNAKNWVDNIAPVAGDDLVFPAGIGALDRTTNNNFAPGTAFGSITLTGSDYTLSGNRIRLNDGEIIASTATEPFNVIEFDIDFSGAHRIEAASLLNLDGALKAVLGAQDLVIDAPLGLVRFSGATANTFGRAIHVRQGTLFLGKTPGIDAISGPLIIGDATAAAPAKVQFTDVDQLKLGAQVTLRANANGSPAILDIQSSTEKLNLTMRGGRVEGDAVSKLILNEDFTADFENFITTSVLDLNGFGRNITVNGKLTIQSTITNGALQKRGPGELFFRGSFGSNTYIGDTNVSEGNLVLDNPNGNAIAGALRVGSSGGLTFGRVFIARSNQIADNATVRVNSEGALFSEANEQVGNLLVSGDLNISRDRLTVSGELDMSQPGASISMSGNTELVVHGLTTITDSVIDGAGKLFLNGGLTMTGGSITGRSFVKQFLTTHASAGPAVIAGELTPVDGLSKQFIFEVADGPAARDLRIPAVIKDGTGELPTIRKRGAGTLAWNGDNTFTSVPIVVAGTLLVNGNAPNTRYRVNGGVLGGTGFVNLVSVNRLGAISPGQSPGTLKAQHIDFEFGGTLVIELNGLTPGTQHDQLDVTDLILGREVNGVFPTLDVRPGFNAAVGDTFKIVKGLADTGIVQGFFRDTLGNVLGEGATFVAGGQPFSITYQADGGDAVQLQRVNSAPAFRNRTITSALNDVLLAVLAGTITEIDTGDTFFLDVNWGDGSAPETFTFPPGSDGLRVNVTHRYAGRDSFLVNLLWRDQRGGFNRDTLKFRVEKT